jgi:hypothetical protein
MEAETFMYITDATTRRMIKTAYDVVLRLDLVDFFKSQLPPKSQGYMFWDAPELKLLGSDLMMEHHSGASFAYVCRNLQAYFGNPNEFKNKWNR